MKVSKKGSLCFWGEWFGRPYDNIHVVEKCIYDEELNILTLLFKQHEECIIINPSGIINTDETFQIDKADHIIWKWYVYGKPITKENIRQIEYKNTNEGLFFINTNMNSTSCINPLDYPAIGIY